MPKRKNDLGRSLEEFFGENFLQEAIIRERVVAADISRRIGEWAAQPENARRVVDEVTEIAGIALSKVGDRQVTELVEAVLVPRFREEPIAPLIGTFVVEMVRDDLHHGVVDLALEELHRWLVENPDTVRDVLSERAPWWAPPRLNEAVTTRIHTETVRWIDDIRQDPLHHARSAVDSMLAPAGTGPAVRRRHPGAGRGPEEPVARPSAVHLDRASRCGTRSARPCWARSTIRTARCATGCRPSW